MRTGTGRRRFVAAAVVVVASAAGLLATQAGAHQSPPGCGTATINADLGPTSGLNIIHRNGDRLDLVLRIRNNAPNVCDVTNATIGLSVPNPDGTPGPTVNVVTGQNIPAGTEPTAVATVPYVVNLNPGVFSAPVTVSFSGTFHGTTDSPSAGSATAPVVISRPQANIVVSASTTNGPAPLATTFSYEVTNTSALNPPDPAPRIGATTGDTSILADDACSPVVFTGGDTVASSPPQLEIGEVWTFSCQALFPVRGTFTSTARIIGTSTRDGRPWPDSATRTTIVATGEDPPPRNDFSITGSRRNKDGGVTLRLDVPGAGDLTADDEPGSKDLVKAAGATAAGAGMAELRLRPSQQAKRRLVRGKRLSAQVRVGFTPTGGAPADQTTTAKLKKPKPKR